MSCLIRFALAALLTMLASAAPAQPYPTRPIRMLVSFPPGGAALASIVRTAASAKRMRHGMTILMMRWSRAAGSPRHFAACGRMRTTKVEHSQACRSSGEHRIMAFTALRGMGSSE